MVQIHGTRVNLIHPIYVDAPPARPHIRAQPEPEFQPVRAGRAHATRSTENER
jgi:hypothetical protein